LSAQHLSATGDGASRAGWPTDQRPSLPT